MTFLFRRFRAISMIELSIGMFVISIMAMMAMRGMTYVRRAKLIATANQIILLRHSIKESDLRKPAKTIAKLHRNKLNKSEKEIDPPACGGSFKIEEGQLVLRVADKDFEDLCEMLNERHDHKIISVLPNPK